MNRSHASEKVHLVITLGLALLVSKVLAGGLTSGQVQAESVTVEPAAHAAFLAWASKHGYSGLKPVETQEGGHCWSVRESSPNEYLYELAACPGEGITTVRVVRQGTVWKAEEAFWQCSVGKPSWQEMVERDLQAMPQGTTVKMILERDDTVVVTLVRPEDTGAQEAIPQEGDADFNWNFSRFTRGDDGLWRCFMVYDALGHPDSTYGTAEDALIAFALKNFPKLSILGDGAQAQEARHTGKVCWTLKSDTGDRRTYMIGPAFSAGEEVEVVRHRQGWLGLPPDRFP